jgi:hypothetical protein
MAIVEGVTQSSYRKVQKRINRQRYQNDCGTPMRSLQNIVESEGNDLQNYIEEKTQEILLNNSYLFEKDTVNEHVSISDNQLDIKLKTKKRRRNSKSNF